MSGIGLSFSEERRFIIALCKKSSDYSSSLTGFSHKEYDLKSKIFSIILFVMKKGRTILSLSPRETSETNYLEGCIVSLTFFYVRILKSKKTFFVTKAEAFM